MSSLLVQASNLLLQLPYGVFPPYQELTLLLDGLFGGSRGGRGGCVSESCFSTLSLSLFVHFF